MRPRRLLTIALLLVVSAAANPQKKDAPPQHPSPPRAYGGPGPGPHAGMPKAQGPAMAGNPNIFERLNRMNPQQRERVLSNMPPDRREKIENGLRRYNSLPPGDRDQLRQRFDNFKQLPPEQQDALRRNFRQFTMLPDDRRMLVRQELNQLQSMTPEQREQRMDSEEFRSRFDGRERRLLDSFTRLMPPPK